MHTQYLFLLVYLPWQVKHMFLRIMPNAICLFFIWEGRLCFWFSSINLWTFCQNQPLMDYFWGISRDWERLHRTTLNYVWEIALPCAICSAKRTFSTIIIIQIIIKTSIRPSKQHRLTTITTWLNNNNKWLWYGINALIRYEVNQSEYNNQ